MSVPLTAIPVSCAPPRAGDSAGVQVDRRAFLGLILVITAFWMVQHAYEGVVHDSMLYAFAALARLHPESLGHDVFLRLGTQDRFTVFSPIAAVFIEHLGLERAAALITFIAQLGFFACGWLLARRLMPPALAVLAIALLVMLPPVFGDGHIFSYIEPFMTARLPAEVFVLAALASALAKKYVPSALCMIAATALHPIMASAGCSSFGSSGPSARRSPSG